MLGDACVRQMIIVAQCSMNDLKYWFMMAMVSTRYAGNVWSKWIKTVDSGKKWLGMQLVVFHSDEGYCFTMLCD